MATKISSRFSYYTLRAKYIVLGIRYPILKKRVNLKLPPIKLCGFSKKHKTSSTTTDIIIMELFGRSSIWLEPEHGDLIVPETNIEPILQAKNKRLSYCWGGGLNRNKPIKTNNIVFKIVKGSLTKQLVKQSIPVGDPRLLVNVAFNQKKIKRSEKIGIIFHEEDKPPMHILKALSNDARFEIINRIDHPRNVVKKIASCKLLLSSSLQELIFADSLSIPNAFLKIEKSKENSFNISDYYSNTKRRRLTIDINSVVNNTEINTILAKYKPLDSLLKIQQRLVKEFPL